MPSHKSLRADHCPLMSAYSNGVYMGFPVYLGEGVGGYYVHMKSGTPITNWGVAVPKAVSTVAFYPSCYSNI